jgi:hypothetical protein
MYLSKEISLFDNEIALIKFALTSAINRTSGLIPESQTIALEALLAQFEEIKLDPLFVWKY